MRILPVVLIALLAGCAVDGAKLRPGVSDAAAVRADMGAPGEVLKAVHGGEIWFYPRGRIGRQTFRAEFAPDGKLLKVEQVLYEQNFDRIIAGKTTRDELRRLLGPPNVEWLAMNGWETNWEYRYRWAQQEWVVTFGIDQKGVVTGQHRRSEVNDSTNRL
jgi:hypothetical protein